MTGRYCEKELKNGDCFSAVMRLETSDVRTVLLQHGNELLKNSLANRTDT